MPAHLGTAAAYIASLALTTSVIAAENVDLKSSFGPQPLDTISEIDGAKRSISTACRELGYTHFTHHDFHDLFATTCIESGVDIPTVSRWLGHKDGGALAMRVYGHLRQDHSLASVKKVTF